MRYISGPSWGPMVRTEPFSGRHGLEANFLGAHKHHQRGLIVVTWLPMGLHVLPLPPKMATFQPTHAGLTMAINGSVGTRMGPETGYVAFSHVRRRVWF